MPDDVSFSCQRAQDIRLGDEIVIVLAEQDRGVLDPAQVAGLVRQAMEINAFGDYLYFLASFFNHSCRPNLVQLTNVRTRELIYVTAKDISAGEELTIIYTAHAPLDFCQGDVCRRLREGQPLDGGLQLCVTRPRQYTKEHAKTLAAFVLSDPGHLARACSADESIFRALRQHADAAGGIVFDALSLMNSVLPSWVTGSKRQG